MVRPRLADFFCPLLNDTSEKSNEVESISPVGPDPEAGGGGGRAEDVDSDATRRRIRPLAQSWDGTGERGPPFMTSIVECMSVAQYLLYLRRRDRASQESLRILFMEVL